jgi:3-methyladenine DNA glycosylase AlkD
MATKRKNPTESAKLSATQLAKEIVNRVDSLPGRTVPAFRLLRREYSKLLGQADPGLVLKTAGQLVERQQIACRFVAYELICHHPAALKSLNSRQLISLGRGLDSWGSVDCFACYLAGRAWHNRQVPDALIHRWAASADRWWRRAALVSTVPLNSRAQGGTGDSARTLTVCRLLIRDRDDMVVKAMSWALRELAKRDPKAVESFVLENQLAIASRVIREMRNKLTTGRKNPLLKRISN